LQSATCVQRRHTNTNYHEVGEAGTVSTHLSIDRGNFHVFSKRS
jgi:hypothetical protein